MCNLQKAGKGQYNTFVIENFATPSMTLLNETNCLYLVGHQQKRHLWRSTSYPLGRAIVHFSQVMHILLQVLAFEFALWAIDFVPLTNKFVLLAIELLL